MTALARPEYLNTAYVSKPWQRGGTLIAEDVWDASEHEERVATRDGYRPKTCGHCRNRMHGLDLRWRVAKEDAGSTGYWIRRYQCFGCGAGWQVLPGFLARYLHRPWHAIQSRVVRAGVLPGTGGEYRVGSKASTARRWTARLLASAMVLIQALVGGAPEANVVMARLSSGANGKELVEGLASAGLLEPRHKLGKLAP